jgi:hypothetical protein
VIAAFRHDECVTCGKGFASALSVGESHRPLKDGHQFIDRIAVDGFLVGRRFPDTRDQVASGIGEKDMTGSPAAARLSH